MSSFKRIIVIDILGGFGNQIFQLMFAKTLQKDNQNKVFLNTEEFYKKSSDITKRQLILSPEFFNLQTASKFLIICFKIFKKFKFFEKIKLYNWVNDDANSTNKSVFTRYTGYWQKYELINDNKEFLLTTLNDISENKDLLNPTIIKGSTLIHVRRGDYLKIEEDLNLNYYKNAILFCKQNIDNFHYFIFTDDKKFVIENSDVFSNYKDLFSDLDNTISDFIKMINFENYVIANSTFSLIPAILSEKQNSNVLYPKQWFRQSSFNFNFPKRWEGINF